MKQECFKTDLGGKELKVTIGDLADQASGSCQIQYGETTVLATAVMSDSGREGIDFFPLTVEFEEKYYAAGKILGSRWVRRESRPSEEAILAARFIDRAIRPRFPKGLKKEVQVIITCLSWDGENDPDTVGLIAASLALSISNIPWSGPIASLRICKKENDFVINPSYAEREAADFELSLAGLESDLAKYLGNKKEDDILINMIETEAAEVKEETVSEAIEMTKLHLKKMISFQRDIAKKVGKKKIEVEQPTESQELEREIKGFLENRLEDCLYQKDKTEQKETLADLTKDLLYYIEGKYPGMGKQGYAKEFLEDEINDLMHRNVLKSDKRPDGRKLNEIRKLEAKVSLLPRTHGSGLFKRGQTKALSILTLGAPSDVKLTEGMEAVGKKRFMHHYNFPPYCSGEVKPLRGPGRREIGHGMLAEKALLPMIPKFEDFPYTIRVVTEILSSNGSTSMASTSSSSLALMDAGVPIKNPVAGIAIGLITDYQGNCKILTDIQGPEDHYGDMDFKVAGTKEGITAIQMDVKIEGVGETVIKEALLAAKKARAEILGVMSKTLSEPRKELSPFAPRIIILQINPAKIREVIGPGGKIINEIIEECGVSIDIEDSGRIFVTAEKESAGDKAVSWIKNLTREVKPGEMFQGKVKRILAFGAFVEILPGQEGLVHISQLAPYRVNKVEDIIKVGDIVPVKVISIDEQGRINLSLKEANK